MKGPWAQPPKTTHEHTLRESYCGRISCVPARHCKAWLDPGEFTLPALLPLTSATLWWDRGSYAVCQEKGLLGPLYSHQQKHCCAFWRVISLEMGAPTIRQLKQALDPRQAGNSSGHLSGVMSWEVRWTGQKRKHPYKSGVDQSSCQKKG